MYPRLFDAGGIVWPLFGCLLGAWALIYLCVCKGIASVGKVAWFTAIFPYVVLSILLVRGVTLPGAADGLAFYLTPEWSKLADSRVWIAASALPTAVEAVTGPHPAATPTNRQRSSDRRQVRARKLSKVLLSRSSGLRPKGQRHRYNGTHPVSIETR